ncbi:MULTISPECIES: YbaB/EbfC family nucleoid-associated protein [Streptomyces]|uniref:YbaB/EbfC family nucleoid-associated protein n=1 Tax=Streptomyces heilongjiangensis TaxID=945052 RepID=A0ABW1BAP5_9ACTN|nr:MULTISPECIES: YbaB/EbfC family nucleoid-associated protein [Streptomyces]MDC2950523.1 YbaB/EbfC family nucleoid-associated protein [Streptomyces heilongjiangensis]
MEPVEERLARAMEALEATRAAVADAEQRLREASVTVTSKDRSVEVTVGARGELRSLRFHDGKYRSMAPAQLSAVLMETIGQARTRMSQQVVDTYRPISESVPRLPGVPGAEIDWDGLLGPDAEGGGPAARRKQGSSLRDEIVEDPAQP